MAWESHDDMQNRFDHLNTKSPPQRSASAKVSSPPHFRLAGLFRSQSSAHSKTGANVAMASKPPPLQLRKKQKKRDLG